MSLDAEKASGVGKIVPSLGVEEAVIPAPLLHSQLKANFTQGRLLLYLFLICLHALEIGRIS